MPLILLWCSFVGFSTSDGVRDELPKYAIARLGTERFRTSFPISCLAVSEDGTRVAASNMSIGSQSRIQVLDTGNGKTVWECGCHGSLIFDLSFSRDGRHLATIGSNDTLTLFDLFKKEKLWEQRDCGREFVRFLPNGKQIATGTGSKFFVLKLADGSIVTTMNGSSNHHGVAISHDGSTLAASTEDGNLNLWSLADGQHIRSFPICQTHATSLEFAPDDQRIAHAGFSGEHAVWDVKTGKELWRITPKRAEEARSIAFSQNGSELYAMHPRPRVFDARTGKILREMTTANPGQTGAFNRDRSMYFGSGFSAYRCDNRIVRTDLKTLRPIPEYDGHTNSIDSVVFAEGGKTILTAAGPDLVRRWDPSTGKLHSELPERAIGLETTDDGNTVVFCKSNGDIVIREMRTGNSSSISRGKLIPELMKIWISPGNNPVLYFLDKTNIQRYDLAAKSYRTPIPSGDPNEFHAKRIPHVTPRNHLHEFTANHFDESAPSIIHYDATSGKMKRQIPLNVIDAGHVHEWSINELRFPIIPRAYLPDNRYCLGESIAGIVLAETSGYRCRRILCKESRQNNLPDSCYFARGWIS
jgi:WD40 repeat protein